MKKILISASNGPIMLELISHLRKSFYVIGIDSNSNGLAKKYCNEFYKSPKGNDPKFINFLKKIGNKVDKIFLFVDEELKNVSKNLKKLKKIKNKIVISPKKTIFLCDNKENLKKYLNKIENINIPNFKRNKLNIIKPKIGRGSKNIIISKNKALLSLYLKNNKYLVEEFIQGKEYTVDCLFDNIGNLIFSLPRERISAQNVSIIGKIIKDSKIDKIVENISKKITFYGPINIQIIKAKKKYFLVEINPRLSGSIIFSIKSGFDPFSILKKLFSKKKINLKKIKYNKTFLRYLTSFHAS